MFERIGPDSANSFPVDPEFRLYGLDHLAALAGVAGLCALLFVLRERLGEATRRRLGHALAAGILLFIVTSYYEIWRSGRLTWDFALPLHLCNVLVLIVLVTLLWPNRPGSELAWYWGMGGAIQALITPDLPRGYPSWDYLQFFLGHGLQLVATVHLVGVMGLHPAPGGVRRAFLALNVYILVVGTLDWLFGWNYGYLCYKPAGASLFDHLGPWPWYLVGAELVALASFLLLSLPWRGANRSR